MYRKRVYMKHRNIAFRLGGLVSKLGEEKSATPNSSCSTVFLSVPVTGDRPMVLRVVV